SPGSQPSTQPQAEGLELEWRLSRALREALRPGDSEQTQCEGQWSWLMLTDPAFGKTPSVSTCCSSQASVNNHGLPLSSGSLSAGQRAVSQSLRNKDISEQDMQDQQEITESGNPLVCSSMCAFAWDKKA
ncbi:hypothetical protein H1C71_034886, partial [Ictidomys tridecemlineatus]